jgi:hypothetical protein
MAYGLDNPGSDSQQKQEISPIMTRPASGTAQSSIQWVPWELSLRWSNQGAKLTHHLHPVLKLQMGGAIPPHLPYAFMAYTGTFFKCLHKLDHWLFTVLVWHNFWDYKYSISTLTYNRAVQRNAWPLLALSLICSVITEYRSLGISVAIGTTWLWVG